jgi:hypothetical protein
MNIIVGTVIIFSFLFFVFVQSGDFKNIQNNFKEINNKSKSNNSNVEFEYNLIENQVIAIRKDNSFDVVLNITNKTDQVIQEVKIIEEKNEKYIPVEISRGEIKTENKYYVYVFKDIKQNESFDVKIKYRFVENDPLTRLIEETPFIYITAFFPTIYVLFIASDKIRNKVNGKKFSKIVKDHLYLVTQISIIYEFGLLLLSELLLSLGVGRGPTLFVILIIFPLFLYILEKTKFNNDNYAKRVYKNSVLIIFVVIMLTQLYTLTFDSNNKETLVVMTQTILGMNIYMRLTAMQKPKTEK